MGRPTDEQFNAALIEAERLRDQGEDDYFLGRSLLNLNHRMKFMEQLLNKAALYLHSGEGAREHAELVRAIEHAEAAGAYNEEKDEDIQPW